MAYVAATSRIAATAISSIDADPVTIRRGISSGAKGGRIESTRVTVASGTPPSGEDGQVGRDEHHRDRCRGTLGVLLAGDERSGEREEGAVEHEAGDEPQDRRREPDPYVGRHGGAGDPQRHQPGGDRGGELDHRHGTDAEHLAGEQLVRLDVRQQDLDHPGALLLDDAHEHVAAERGDRDEQQDGTRHTDRRCRAPSSSSSGSSSTSFSGAGDSNASVCAASRPAALAASRASAACHAPLTIDDSSSTGSLGQITSPVAGSTAASTSSSDTAVSASARDAMVVSSTSTPSAAARSSTSSANVPGTSPTVATS